MSRRKLLLEEMGIAPLWRLREPAGSVAAAEGAASVTAASETADRDSIAEQASGELSSARLPAVEPVRGKRADPAVPPADAEEARGRRQRILQMDWSALKGAVADCVACPLHRTRTQTVFGVGDERADWLFVGEGPGAEEDAKGEPFVGQAGRLLDSMLAAIKLARGHDVYIANVVKCRPPANRNPEEREMSCCEPYLARQIELIQPKLIVALGKVSANHLLQTDASIASLRGRVHQYRGTPLIVTYHPAYLLRSLQEKAKAWVDLCFARETMAAIREGRMGKAIQEAGISRQ
jgi:DNA polymerase